MGAGYRPLQQVNYHFFRDDGINISYGLLLLLLLLFFFLNSVPSGLYLSTNVIREPLLYIPGLALNQL